MTHSTMAPSQVARPAAMSLPTSALYALATAFMLLQHAGMIPDVWTTGAYFDTDDAMRMVQVRALLDGQGWYDLTAWRMAPPNGASMHWSRVVDVPLAL